MIMIRSTHFTQISTKHMTYLCYDLIWRESGIEWKLYSLFHSVQHNRPISFVSLGRWKCVSECMRVFVYFEWISHCVGKCLRIELYARYEYISSFQSIESIQFECLCQKQVYVVKPWRDFTAFSLYTMSKWRTKRHTLKYVTFQLEWFAKGKCILPTSDVMFMEYRPTNQNTLFRSSPNKPIYSNENRWVELSMENAMVFYFRSLNEKKKSTFGHNLWWMNWQYCGFQLLNRTT